MPFWANIRVVHRLWLSRFGGFLATSKFFYTKYRRRRKTNTGFCRLIAPQKSLCSNKKKKKKKKNRNTLSKTRRDVSLLIKYLVWRSQPRELENIDTRSLDVLIANFLLQSKERRRTIIRAHIAEVCDVLRLNFCKCIFCLRWMDKNWTDFKRKGRLQAVYKTRSSEWGFLTQTTREYNPV